MHYILSLIMLLSFNLFAQSPFLLLMDGEILSPYGEDLTLGHGTFTTAEDTLWWFKNNAAITYGDGMAIFTDVPKWAHFYRDGEVMTPGGTYFVEFDIIDYVEGEFWLLCADATDYGEATLQGVYPDKDLSYTSGGHKSAIIEAISTGWIDMYAHGEGTANNFRIDNIVVREVLSP